ncbi:unnamed protein product [Cylindrotheca closterium]|uniref:Uncharacterized protein n=1 Tax=Cylindrotheca closterium TaxID=2856 RepID=A0AAD2CIE2_9STRA|nr:unnamed protein product [Cylindrotheca closterium]
MNHLNQLKLNSSRGGCLNVTNSKHNTLTNPNSSATSKQQQSNQSNNPWLEYLKLSVFVDGFCCHCGDFSSSEECEDKPTTTETNSNSYVVANHQMPSKKNKSNKTRDWTRWISSSLESFSYSSSNQQQHDQHKPNKLPQHELQLQHVQSLPTPPPSRRHHSKQDKNLKKTHGLGRSSSYALKRTGTLNPPFSEFDIQDANDYHHDDDSEAGLEIIMRKYEPPPRPIETSRKLDKKVSFSEIQIFASTTESLSPSSSLTSSEAGYHFQDSPRDPPPHITTTSIDAFEANKPTDPNPIPYHMRFARPPPELLVPKEDLRRASSLMDDDESRMSATTPTKQRSVKWKPFSRFGTSLKNKKNKKTIRKSRKQRSQNNIRVLDATDPKYAKHINMAGIVSRSRDSNYEGMY